MIKQVLVGFGFNCVDVDVFVAADKAREDFKEAEKRSNDIKRSIEDLEKLLRVDLGPQQEFQALQNQCFEYTDRE